jgi:hypothetical protein
VILSEFSGYEADYRIVLLPDGSFGGFEAVASALMEEYGTYLKNMTPENTARITDFKVLNLKVFLTREGDANIFGFSTEFALKPVIYDSAAWWAGNTAPGTGELDGYLTMYGNCVSNAKTGLALHRHGDRRPELKLKRTDGKQDGERGFIRRFPSCYSCGSVRICLTNRCPFHNKIVAHRREPNR